MTFIEPTLNFIQRIVENKDVTYTCRFNRLKSIVQFREGRTIVIGGRPGCCKSTLANLLVFDFLLMNKELNPLILYWNFEMIKEEQILRFISNKTNIPLNTLTDSKWLKEGGSERIQVEVEALKPFEKNALLFYDDAMNATQMHNVMRTFKGRHIINVIDHTRMVRKEGNGTEEMMLSFLMGMLNHVKKEFKTLNIVLSQLNRAVESSERMSSNRGPVLSDLFGADSVGQYADGVIMLHNPSQYGLTTIDIGSRKRVPTLGKIFGYVVKNRHGKNGDVLEFQHIGETFTLTEIQDIE
jgi:replicative DNA helicase